MPYMVTFTINIPPMLAYIYHTWILWASGTSKKSWSWSASSPRFFPDPCEQLQTGRIWLSISYSEVFRCFLKIWDTKNMDWAKKIPLVTCDAKYPPCYFPSLRLVWWPDGKSMTVIVLVFSFSSHYPIRFPWTKKDRVPIDIDRTSYYPVDIQLS